MLARASFFIVLCGLHRKPSNVCGFALFFRYTRRRVAVKTTERGNALLYVEGGKEKALFCLADCRVARRNGAGRLIMFMQAQNKTPLVSFVDTNGV